MHEVVSLGGVERHLEIARDLSVKAHEPRLCYFIDLAILEAKAVVIERQANEEDVAILEIRRVD
jgi:hypothetical protein